MFSSTSRAVAPALLLVLIALAAAGCGSDSSSSSDSASSQDAARVKFTKCMRDNGVDLPDNIGQGGAAALRDVDQNKLNAALKACQKYQQAAVGDISDSQQQEFNDSFAKFASCMRQNGVDVPDVTAGSGPPVGQIPDQNDPKVKAALDKCQDKIPSGGPFGGSGGQ